MEPAAASDLPPPAVAAAPSGQLQERASPATESIAAEGNGLPQLQEVHECPVVVEFVVWMRHRVVIQLLPVDQVQDIRAWVLTASPCTFVTCFAIEYDGQRLADDVQLGTLPSFGPNATFCIVPDKYDARQTLVHVSAMQAMLLGEAMTKDTCSPLRHVLEKYPATTDGIIPPELLKLEMPSPALLCEMQPTGTAGRTVKSIVYNSWNAPPANRRLQGDLAYLRALLEDDVVIHITAHIHGFYISRMTDDKFDPREHPTKPCHAFTLFGLLSQYSAQVKTFLANRQQSKPAHLADATVHSPWEARYWCLPPREHRPSELRADNEKISWSEYDPVCPGMLRDWNDNLQYIRELPNNTEEEKMIRQRTIYRFYCEFADTARRGAMAIVHGNVPALNVTDESSLRIFIWNNIFFSYALDSRDIYKDYGGDEAAHKAAGSEVKGVAAYNFVDQAGLCTLATAVVDYLGCRLIAQSIAPGILGHKSENAIIYGRAEPDQEMALDPALDELLQRASPQLCIKPHKVSYVPKDGPEVVYTIATSSDTKGIRGTDNRLYIMDLTRTTPMDVNFLSPVPEESWIPRHSFYTHRLEFVADFFQHRLDGAPEEGKGSKEEAAALPSSSVAQSEPASTEPAADETTVEPVTSAAGAQPPPTVECWANPDVFTNTRLADDADKIEKDKLQVREMASMMVQTVVPAFVDDLVSARAVFCDGSELTTQMHHRGIGMRYLGMITKLLLTKTEPCQYWVALCVQEMIARAAKHVLRQDLRDAAPGTWAQVACHFLNILLGSADHVSGDSIKARKNKKKSDGVRNGVDAASSAMARTHKSLWATLTTTVHKHFRFALKENVFKEYGVQHASILRSLCIKAGLVVAARAYLYDADEDPFRITDIVDIVPVVKDAEKLASNHGVGLLTVGQHYLDRGAVREAFECFEKANYIFQQVHGGLYATVGECYHFMAICLCKLNHMSLALQAEEKCTAIFEQVLGFDHPETFRNYTRYGIMCITAQLTQRGLALLHHARNLAILALGPRNPEIGAISLHIARVLLDTGKAAESIPFLQEALSIQEKYFVDPMVLITTHKILTRAYRETKNYRAALDHSQQSFNLASKHFGENHTLAQEWREIMSRCTSDAVSLERIFMGIVGRRPVTASLADGDNSDAQTSPTGAVSVEKPISDGQTKKPKNRKKKKSGKQQA